MGTVYSSCRYSSNDGTTFGQVACAIALVVAILSGCVFLTFCGKSGAILRKNIQSDFGHLERKVQVYDSWSSKVIWEYTGEVYLRGDKGNYSIIYKAPDGKMLKNDFVGQHVVVSMQEVQH